MSGSAPTSGSAPASGPFRIGPFTVLGALGRGAMGMVYAAYDEKLDRKVALKLLHSLQETGTMGRARMLREAQALARVSHPNVVQVYEVGEYEEEIYIAMEFVRGETLRGWMTGKPRRWREVLAVYVQAGRGLAAAHAAGVVHRDFKPDNVMIGDDGRVRVMDFGLARSLERPDLDVDTTLRSQDPGLSSTLTAVGTVLGTPAYMAPEQFGGQQEVGAPADQFAFCVALFEALYGHRPFTGDNLRKLAANIALGNVREPTRRGVPRWLRAVIGRGLSAPQGQRWPGMAALLTRIERGQALARVRAAAMVAAVVGVVVVAGWAWRQADVASRTATCVAAGADLDRAWNDEARAQLRRSFAATGASDAADAADRTIPWLDRHAAAWQHARAEACIDHDVRAVWSAETLDRALWCLDERRMEFESLVGELQQADRALMQKAIPTAAGLDPIAACRDAAALARLPVPPPESRAEAAAARAELARSSNLHAAGKFAEALAAADAARTRADALAWPPLRAAAGLRVGLALDRLGKFQAAAKELEDAGFTAMEAGALGLAADASAALTVLVGQRLARFDEGLRWSRLAKLAIDVLEPQPGLRTATNLLGVAIVRSLTGDLAGARALQEQALAIQEAALGRDHLQVAATLQNLTLTAMGLAAYQEALAFNERSLAIREAVLGPEHSDVGRSLTTKGLVLRRMGDYPAALAVQERAAAVTERAFGPDHPDLAVVLTNVANMHLLMGAIAEVGPLHTRALAIREKALGPDHPDVAGSLSNLAIYHQQTGDAAMARELTTRALAIREKVFGPEHREVATSLVNLGGINIGLGAAELARAQLERALAILEALSGPDHPDLVAVLTNLGHLDIKARRLAVAEARLGRAVAIIEKAQGPAHPSLVDPLVMLAKVALDAKHPADAVGLAGRAVALIEAQKADPKAAADARSILAEALWDAPAGAGRDRGRALALARTARDGLRGAGGSKELLAAVERWLAQHGG